MGMTLTRFHCESGSPQYCCKGSVPDAAIYVYHSEERLRIGESFIEVHVRQYRAREYVPIQRDYPHDAAGLEADLTFRLTDSLTRCIVNESLAKQGMRR